MYLLILGAGSDIARETAKLFASREGANCYLAGRVSMPSGCWPPTWKYATRSSLP
jgi:NAD(P)-dependent dehydrogenase (short-subunit alcohol dehydrogenase family)